jgi:PAS domain S-box-containing protein
MAALAVYVWTRRSVSGAYVLLATLISIGYLLVLGAIEERSTTLAGHVFWLHAQIPGYAAMPVCCLLLALGYAARPMRGWRVAALFVVPAAGVLLHWTNDWHHLYWSRIWIDQTGQTPLIGRTYGVGFWICVAYSYLMTGISAFILVAFLARNRAQRLRTLVFLGAILLPCVASLLYVFEWYPVRYLDITPYALTVTGMCIVWVIFRYRFQGIVPVAARSVVDSMADGVIVLDLDRRVADLNPAAEALLGCCKEKFVGHSATGAFREYADLTPYYQGEGQMAGDARLLSGGKRWLCAASAADVMQGKHRIGRVITLRDVTAERQASEQLREARQAAEAAAIAKSRFLANMSHEIRTPINGIFGMINLTLATDLNPEQREALETVNSCAHSLLGILNDILDVSKIEAGKLEIMPAPFRTVDTLQSAYSTFVGSARSKGIQLTWEVAKDVPEWLACDDARIRQVLLNLVGNALKFTQRGAIRLSASAQGSTGGTIDLHFAVSDTGIGISEEARSFIFEAFRQADGSTSRTYGGTGLGLTISSRLVQLMGGAITVESELGAGSVFRFYVKTRQVAAPPVGATPASDASRRATSARPLHLLLAEDNVVNQKVATALLNRRGHSVVVVGNGRLAVERTETEAFDVILMDLEMPEMDGWTATREIRKRDGPRGVYVPIVALTAHAMSEAREQCMAAGMNSVIVKPFDPAQLYGAIEQLVQHEDVSTHNHGGVPK